MARLVVVQGVGTGSVMPLMKEIVIGRQSGVDLKLEGLNISRRHARVFPEEGRYWVEDLGSSNGTFVNDAKIPRKTLLSTGDNVRVGPFILKFEAQEPVPDFLIRSETLADISNIDLFRKGAEEKLQAVLQIAHELARSLNIENLLPKIFERLFLLFPQADRALFLVIENGRPQVRAHLTREGAVISATGIQFSRSIVERVMQTNCGIVAEDMPPDLGQSICSLGLRSFICAPLKSHGEKILGVLQLDRFNAGRPFGTDDLYLLTAISIQLSAVLENAHLHQELVQKERMEKELALAREIQAGYLPKAIPAFRGRMELHAMLDPALEVSGDFYDYFLLDENRVAFAIADVCGKGMPAAMFMAIVRTLLRHLAPTHSSPAKLLKTLNDAVSVDNPKGLFVTMLYGICDTTSGRITLARAGHPSPILCSHDGSARELLGPHGWVLGFTDEVPDLVESDLQLQEGESFVLYTDGITEAGSSRDKGLFGTKRLIDLLAAIPATEPLTNWSARLRSGLELFCGSKHCEDDVTFLALRRPFE